MRSQVFVLTGLLAGVINTALATPCGSLGAPLACTITVGAPGSQVMYSATNFSLSSSQAGGGGVSYDASEILIDISTGGALSAVLTFSSGAAIPLFFVNPGQFSFFDFGYDLTLTPVSPGTANYTSRTSEYTASNPAGSFVQLQKLIAPNPACVADTNNNGFSFCSFTVPQPSTISIFDRFLVRGDTVSASVSSFRNVFDAEFTASEIPEPSSIVLAGLGLAALTILRRRS